MPVLPGAGPFAAAGGRVGALLVHGSTGSAGAEGVTEVAHDRVPLEGSVGFVHAYTCAGSP